MASGIELEAVGTADARGAPSGLPGMAAPFRDALDRTCLKRFGLIVVTGAGTGPTTAMLAERGAQVFGEIEDRDTLTDALNAAEQGLTVATSEGGDAITTLLILRRLATDRFTFAAMLRLMIAQRVTAALCTECRRPEQAYGSLSALLGLDPGAILWSAPGCERCGGAGAAAEVGIFEGVEVDPAMRRLIYDGADAPLLARHAFLAMPNLASAARTLARDGVISAEAAVRISRE